MSFYAPCPKVAPPGIAKPEIPRPSIFPGLLDFEQLLTERDIGLLKNLLFFFNERTADALSYVMEDDQVLLLSRP